MGSTGLVDWWAGGVGKGPLTWAVFYWLILCICLVLEHFLRHFTLSCCVMLGEGDWPHVLTEKLK